MAWTQTDLDTLDAAIATGALSVHYADGRAVTYRSHAEMLATRGLLVATLATAAGTTGRSRLLYPTITSGIG